MGDNDLMKHLDRMRDELKGDIAEVRETLREGLALVHSRHQECRAHCDKITSGVFGRLSGVETQQAVAHGKCEAKQDTRAGIQALFMLLFTGLGALAMFLALKW
jgi:hypothetical protein